MQVIPNLSTSPDHPYLVVRNIRELYIVNFSRGEKKKISQCNFYDNTGKKTALLKSSILEVFQSVDFQKFMILTLECNKNKCKSTKTFLNRYAF